MTFTYVSNDSLAWRDSVRLLVQDTDANEVLLQDEEIDILVALESGDTNADINVFRVASECARAIATNFGRQGQQEDDRVRVSFNLKAMDYRKRADELLARSRRGALPFCGGISVSDKQTAQQDTDRVVPQFSRDMTIPPGVPTAVERGAEPGAIWPQGVGV